MRLGEGGDGGEPSDAACEGAAMARVGARVRGMNDLHRRMIDEARAATARRAVPQRRPTVAEPTTEAYEAGAIVRDWMAPLGYTADEIAEGESDRDHAACDTENGSWFCVDEYGKSRHPYQDELDDVAALVMFVLEHPALAAA